MSSNKPLKQLQGNSDVGHGKAEELELGEQATETYSGVGVEGEERQRRENPNCRAERLAS